MSSDLDDFWFCRQGFGASVCAHAAGLPVKTDTPVVAVTRTPAGVDIETAEGKITAGHVVVTVSVGVLSSGAMLFDPADLPIQEDTWVSYPIEDISGSMARGGGILCNISGSGLCSFEHVGNFAREMEAAGEDAAIDFALSRMADVFGNSIRNAFIKGHATRWAANRYTLGDYSGTLPGAAGLRPLLRAPHEQVIHFAGEAMNVGETVCISGAHKEGLRAAQEVIAAT